MAQPPVLLLLLLRAGVQHQLRLLLRQVQLLPSPHLQVIRELSSWLHNCVTRTCVHRLLMSWHRTCEVQISAAEICSRSTNQVLPPSALRLCWLRAEGPCELVCSLPVLREGATGRVVRNLLTRTLVPGAGVAHQDTLEALGLLLLLRE